MKISLSKLLSIGNSINATKPLYLLMHRPFKLLWLYDMVFLYYQLCHKLLHQLSQSLMNFPTIRRMEELDAELTSVAATPHDRAPLDYEQISEVRKLMCVFERVNILNEIYSNILPSFFLTHLHPLTLIPSPLTLTPSPPTLIHSPSPYLLILTLTLIPLTLTLTPTLTCDSGIIFSKIFT